MQPKVHARFWEDDDVGALSPELKLVVLWLMTNSTVDILGISRISDRKFTFETGIPIDALQRACAALPRGILKVGRTVWLCNFIAYQFGREQKLIRNTCFRTILSQFNQLQDKGLQEAILQRYPEIRAELSKSVSPPKTASPSNGHTKPIDGVREGEGEGGGEGKGDTVPEGGPGETKPPPDKPSIVIPDDREVFRFAADWVGEPSSGTPAPIPPEFVSSWLAQMTGRSRGWPLDWERALIASWREHHRLGPDAGFGKKNGVLDLKTQLDAVDTRIREHPGNPESVSYVGSNADASILDEFKELRKTRRGILEKISKGGTP